VSISDPAEEERVSEIRSNSGTRPKGAACGSVSFFYSPPGFAFSRSRTRFSTVAETDSAAGAATGLRGAGRGGTRSSPDPYVRSGIHAQYDVFPDVSGFGFVMSSLTVN
jgi:hypothetical protein